MTKVLLTSKQFEDMASKQCDSINVLNLIKKMIDLIPSPNDEKVKSQPAFYYAQVYGALDHMFVALNKIITDLDDSSAILYSVAERADLEALGVVIKSEQTEKATIAASVTQDELEHDKAMSLYECDKLDTLIP